MQIFFCTQLHVDEAHGSVQWKMTQYPRLCVKTADTYNNSYLLEVKLDLRQRGMSWWSDVIIVVVSEYKAS